MTYILYYQVNLNCEISKECMA